MSFKEDSYYNNCLRIHRESAIRSVISLSVVLQIVAFFTIYLLDNWVSDIFLS